MTLLEVEDFFKRFGKSFNDTRPAWWLIEDDVEPLDDETICVVMARRSIILHETVYHALVLGSASDLNAALSDNSLSLTNGRRYSTDVEVAREAQLRFAKTYVNPKKVAREALKVLHAKRAQTGLKEIHNVDHS